MMASIEALLLVRDLFLRADAYAHDASTFGRMLAPLLYDLCAETALKLVISERSLEEPQELKGMLSVVANGVNNGNELPGAGGVRNLRNERNLVQHDGCPRSEHAIEKGRAAVERLLSFLFPVEFGLSFATLSARKLVTDPAVGAALDEGERYFANREYDFSIACAGLAFRLADKAAREPWDRAFGAQRASDSEPNPSSLAARLDRVEAIFAAVVFGYEPSQLSKLNALVDGRIATMNPNHGVRVSSYRGDASAEDARFVLDFAAFHAARHARRSGILS